MSKVNSLIHGSKPLGQAIEIVVVVLLSSEPNTANLEANEIAMCSE